MSIETYREKADWEGENSDEEEDEEGEDVSPRVSESGSVRAIFVFRHWWRESRSIDAEEDRVRKKAEETERERGGKTEETLFVTVNVGPELGDLMRSEGPWIFV